MKNLKKIIIFAVIPLLLLSSCTPTQYKRGMISAFGGWQKPYADTVTLESYWFTNRVAEMCFKFDRQFWGEVISTNEQRLATFDFEPENLEQARIKLYQEPGSLNQNECVEAKSIAEPGMIKEQVRIERNNRGQQQQQYQQPYQIQPIQPIQPQFRNTNCTTVYGNTNCITY